MTETVTLQLSDKVIEKARSEAERAGRPIEDVLTEWLEQDANDLSAALMPEGVHVIYTPVDNYGTAEALGKIWQDYLTSLAVKM